MATWKKLSLSKTVAIALHAPCSNLFIFYLLDDVCGESIVAGNATLASTQATKNFYCIQLLGVAIRVQAAEARLHCVDAVWKYVFFFLKYTVIGLLRSFVLYRLNLQESRCVPSLCSFFFFLLAESRPLDYTGNDVSAIRKILLVTTDRDFMYKCTCICF